MSAPKPNGSNAAPKTPRSLEADIALLTQLLSATGTNTGEGPGGAQEGEVGDVTELLRQIQAAEDVAEGMEEQLDGIIDSLDDLLRDLEARLAGGGPQAGTEQADAAVVVVEEEVAIIADVPEAGK